MDYYQHNKKKISPSICRVDHDVAYFANVGRWWHLFANVGRMSRTDHLNM